MFEVTINSWNSKETMHAYDVHIPVFTRTAVVQNVISVSSHTFLSHSDYAYMTELP
jgi:hypothetical protein